MTTKNQIFYRPQSPLTGRMWDTWLYWHEHGPVLTKPRHQEAIP
jgi:hypothetical protein